MVLQRAALLALVVVNAAGCSLLKEKDPSDVDEYSFATKPIPADKAGEAVGTVAHDWFYGQGLGDTAITAGTVLIFPPYLAVVLGNAALSITGYEPITMSRILPGDAGKGWDNAYNAIASSPGHLTAAVAGKEYRTDSVIKDDMRKLLSQNGADKGGGKTQPATPADHAATGERVASR